VQRSAMRRCLKGLGGFPTSIRRFILGPSHGTVGRLEFLLERTRTLYNLGWFCSPAVQAKLYDNRRTIGSIGGTTPGLTQSVELLLR